jgi:hypothetical protein
MRFAASLAAALMLPACSSPGEANQQDEDLQAAVFEAAVAVCSEDSARHAQGPYLDVDLVSACECGVDKVLDILPSGAFAAITNEEDVAALVAKLRLPAGRAAKDCAEKRRPNKAESRQRVRSFSGQHT